MQEFEKPRYAEALARFEAAFWDGFDRGVRLLASGEVQRDSAVGSVEYVDVPRDDVLDGVIEGRAGTFEQAGFRAATATRRAERRPVLDGSLSDPDGRDAHVKGVLRWCVLLGV